MTAAIVLWNTVYLERATQALRDAGRLTDDDMLQFLPPLGWEHINLTGDDCAAIGEYDDPWDAMSWANSYVATTPFGYAPTALVAPHLERMGWLPRSRIAVHGAGGASETTYTLAATNHPEASGALLVRVPFARMIYSATTPSNSSVKMVGARVSRQTPY